MKFEVIALQIGLLTVALTTEAHFQMGSGSYSYSWQVSDTGSGNEYGHRESRTGDSGQSTEGEYFVRLPDGRLQTVTYHVSPYSGFRAKVLYDHEASAPPQPPPSPFRRQPKPHKQQSLFNYKDPYVSQPTYHSPVQIRYGTHHPPPQPSPPLSPTVQSRPPMLNHHHNLVGPPSHAQLKAADTSRDPHFRSAKEMRSFDLTEPLFYISTKRIKGNSGKKKLKHKSMKHEGRIHHHVAAMGMRERPQVKQLPFRSRLYF